MAPVNVQRIILLYPYMLPKCEESKSVMPPTNAEIWSDFAKSTTISGLHYIHEAKHWLVKVSWFVIFAMLVLMTTYQCLGAVKLYLSYPTVVNKRMHYRTLNFPSVTFCPTNPFKASKVELLSPELKSMMDELKGTIYDINASTIDQTNESDVQHDSMSRSKRQAMNFDEPCPSGYFRIEGGCYLEANSTTTWFKAYNICQSFGANLPIFTNFSNYLSFFRWHSKNYSNEIWVGLYSLNDVKWTWSDGCPYDAFYPSFWGDSALSSQNAPLYNRLTARGVLWSDGIGSCDVICYKPVSSEDETCKLQGFQMKPNPPSILCHNSLVNLDSWWCVNNHPEYENVTSAVAADSCFCLLFDSTHYEMTADQAAVSCKLINASLADLRSARELDMLDRLIANFDAEDEDLMNACPFKATFANHSCFNLLPLISSSFAQADHNCYMATGGGRLMSLHSPYEHNAAFYEYWEKGRPWTLPSFGVYIGMYRNYSLDSTLWKWSDGTPFDYMPGWSVWVIGGQPDSNDPQTFFITQDGLLHDYHDFNTYAICRKNLSLHLFWTSLTMLFDNETSEACTFWSNNNCKIVDSNISIVTDPSWTTTGVNFALNRHRLLTMPQNGKASGAICRRDRKPIDACTGGCNGKTYDATLRTDDIVATPEVFVTNTDALKPNKDSISQVSRFQKQMLYLTENMDTQLLSQLSYNIEDLLLYSTYDGVHLNFSDYDTKYYKGNGNCFVFNQKEPLRKVIKAGHDRGFEILLKLNILEYLIVSFSPGFLFMIHSPNETIYPDSQALRISTGLQNDVALTYVTQESFLEPHPYSNCLLDAPSGYSTNACYESCEQLAILTHCDCCDPQLPSVSNASYCSYDSDMCVEAVKSFGNFSPSYYGCSCPPPCKSVTYDRTLSSAKLSFSSAKLASSFKKPDINQSIDDDAKYTAKVNVFFRTLSYATSEQSPAYTFTMLVSDLAQFMGLWLGFSAITFFEIMPLISSLSGCRTCRNIRH